MNINLEFDPSAEAAPAGFEAAFLYAAAELGSLIASTATVNIAVGYGEINGAPIETGDISLSEPLAGSEVSYSTIASHMPGVTLPTSPDPFYYVASAQQKAWGIMPASAAIDGAVGVSSEYTYATDPLDRAVPGEFDLIGIAEHEITQAMGRIAGDGPMDFVTYSGPGQIAPIATGGYFSIDGGETGLAQFASSDDTADFVGTNDPFDLAQQPGTAAVFTKTDQTLMSAIGFAEPTQFTVTDMTAASGSLQEAGTPYSGPVTGLARQLILVSSDNLNVVSHTPSSFIKTSAGDDAIDVSAAAGNNVLDGGTGSNFLTGGAGDDTFFLDDRQSAVTWSTINDFHAGDVATIWGVTVADFDIQWSNGGGATGYTGLTASITAAGHPAATLTLAGLSMVDLWSRLVVSFGTTADQGGLAGSAFMQIRAG